MRYLTSTFLFLFLLLACRGEVREKTDQASQKIFTEIAEGQQVETPDELLGELFIDVQMQRVFEDGKTFVDARALHPYDSIVLWYKQQKLDEGFNLKDFVLEHFEMPPMVSSGFKSDPGRTAAEHVEALWPVLTRTADTTAGRTSLLPLPEPYVVPGGRFREVYYWDSYFTMLGLAESGRNDLIASMVSNFAHLIDNYGHIPNGNRSYYVSRSQPPFFAYMVDLLAQLEGEETLEEYRDAMREEYEFWMSGHSLELDSAAAHLVDLPVGRVNRYYDYRNTPRQESYREDHEIAESLEGAAKEKKYLDLRAGAESGWDFSTRWFEDGQNLSTIVTTDIVPVDLNALLYGMEDILIRAFPDDIEFQERLRAQQEVRKKFLAEYSWDEADGSFRDFNWRIGERTDVPSLAMVYPLFTGMATQEQADAIAATLHSDFLKPGGVVSTLNNSGQQWDAPNGWAPLQWMTVAGLDRYGHKDLARTIAERWVALNEKVYANTGKFVEKYNVQDLSLEAGGGEYPVQDGFGWSNGVYLALKAYLEKTAP